MNMNRDSGQDEKIYYDSNSSMNRDNMNRHTQPYIYNIDIKEINKEKIFSDRYLLYL